MMVKQEASQIRETTLKSITDYIGHVIIYDTGSTDGTQEVIREYCQARDMRCDIKEGKFVNFAISLSRSALACLLAFVSGFPWDWLRI
jgi:glycosyltransferase involved in cell wall biosynthesis